MLAAAVAMQDGEIAPWRPDVDATFTMCLRGRPERLFKWFAVREHLTFHVMVFDGDECIFHKRGVQPTTVFQEFMHEEDEKEQWRRYAACLNARERMLA